MTFEQLKSLEDGELIQHVDGRFFTVEQPFDPEVGAVLIHRHENLFCRGYYCSVGALGAQFYKAKPARAISPHWMDEAADDCIALIEDGQRFMGKPYDFEADSDSLELIDVDPTIVIPACSLDMREISITLPTARPVKRSGLLTALALGALLVALAFAVGCQFHSGGIQGARVPQIIRPTFILNAPAAPAQEQEAEQEADDNAPGVQFDDFGRPVERIAI